MHHHNHNFNHLKPPPEALAYTPAKQQITTTYKGKDRRFIFYKVPFTPKEEQMLLEFRAFISKSLNEKQFDDPTLLRYLYSGDCQFDESLEKLKVYAEWIHNPAIQTINDNAIKILRQGFIYNYGRDKLHRPIIILNLTRVNFDKYSMDDYYCAINALVSTVISHMMVPGKIERYLFITDIGGKGFTSLPFDSLMKVISKLSLVYSLKMGHMMIINLNFMLKLTWNTFKPFIHQETKNRISIFTTDEMNQLQKYIDPEQLQFKYGGNRNNLVEHWPPRLPKSFVKRMSSIRSVHGEDESMYFSIIDENEKYFMDDNEDAQTNYCCSMQENSSCTIY